MSRSKRLIALNLGGPLAAILIAAACAPIPAVSQTTAPAQADAPSPANPPIVFAQTQSDLPVDPAARFGRLDNGMGYILYRNGTPPGTAAVWMRVAAGSIMEQEDQRGLAHFIEHMAFQGSTHVAEGEMIRLLQRDGLQFGADTNASTSFFETVYNLNLPVASDRIVNQALFLMRETAGNVAFDPAAIDRERGVVLSEERARATVGFRAGVAQMAQLFPGAKYPDRLPIGLVNILETAERAAFLRFYNDFYRPEYTTLIVAGDVDLDRVEAEIRARFSDWHPGPQSPTARTDYGTVTPRTAPEARVFVADGLTDSLSISWVSAPDDGVETRARSFDDTLMAIGMAILNERYGHQANRPDATFAQASLQRQDVPHTASLIGLNILPKPGQDRPAFEQTMAMLRQYLAAGPTQDELDRMLLIADQTYGRSVAAAGTMHTQTLADRILDTLGSQRVLQSPTQSQAEFAAWKPQITLAAVNAALRKVDPAKPPLIWRQAEAVGSFDEGAMLKSYLTAIQAPIADFSARRTEAWPYTEFGTPSTITSTETLADVEATRVTFANGVVLTVKPTTFEDNAVHVAIQVGNGLMGIRPEQGPTLFMARRLGLGAGGLGRMSADDINDALAGKAYGLSFGIGENATTLSGSTTKADFGLQMQVLAAFMTDAGFRADALDRVKSGLPSAYNSSRTSPEGVFGLMAQGDLYGDDPRFSTTALDQALAVDNDSIAALVKDQLGHGPVEVTIVGDVTLEEAVREITATFSALDPLPPAVSTPQADRLRFPTADLRRTYTHDGREDQGLSVIAWPTTDASDPRRTVVLELLAAVLSARELDEVRENQGATYTVSAASNMSEHFPGFGFMITRATVRPELNDAFYDTVSSIVAGLRERPVTPDELIRARQPLLDRLGNEKRSNGYWLGRLVGTIRDPEQNAVIEAGERHLATVTAEEIQQASQAYLDMSKALRIQVEPRQGAKQGS